MRGMAPGDAQHALRVVLALFGAGCVAAGYAITSLLAG